MNLTRRIIQYTGVLAIVALIAPTLAVGAPQQQVEDRRPAAPDVTVEIDEIIVGRVQVTGWGQNEVYVTGTIGRDVDEFAIEGGPDTIEISAGWNDFDWDDEDESDNRRRWRGHERDSRDVEIDIEIMVPVGASLEIAGVTASIIVNGVDGSIELETVTGNVEYSGNATMIDIANVTGSITARAGNVREGNFESVQGAIHFEGAVAPGAELDFETVMGSVTLVLPADVSAEFDIETFQGDIENEFGAEPRSTSRWLPSKELSFSTGGGDAEIYIETLQGKVTLRKQ